MRAILKTDSIKKPLTGIGRYTLELAKQFDAMHSGVCFVGGLGKNYRFFDNRYAINKQGHLLECLKKNIKTSFLLSRLYPSIKGIHERIQLRQYKGYVVHSPNFYLPYTSNKTIVTIHDLSMFVCPECFEPANAKMMREVCERSIRKADALITISNTVKKQLCELFNYPKERVYVTHLASSSNFCARTQHECSSVLNKFNLRYKSYALFVGTIEPRKNLVTLLKAYECLPKEFKLKYPLVIVGFSGWKNEIEQNLIRKGKYEGWVKYLSYLCEFELNILYAGCGIFCFPSRYEGFGLPVVEAMNSGLPVICSDIPVLREIAGNAPWYVPCDDVLLWRDALLGCLNNNQLLSIMGEKSVQQGASYSWSSCAKMTLKAYAETLKAPF